MFLLSTFYHYSIFSHIFALKRAFITQCLPRAFSINSKAFPLSQAMDGRISKTCKSVPILKKEGNSHMHTYNSVHFIYFTFRPCVKRKVGNDCITSWTSFARACQSYENVGLMFSQLTTRKKLIRNLNL